MTEESTPPRRRGRPKLKELEDVGRKGLIEAAKKVFASHSPDKVNRRLFAELAGVDPNLIRYYFGDMHRLMAELLTDSHNQARLRLLGHMEGFSVEERIRFRVEQTVRMFRDQPNHHQMVRTVIYDRLTSEEHGEWAKLLRDAVAELQATLDEGIASGLIRKDIDAAGLHLLIIAACEFWATNEPVIAVLFGPEKPGSDLDEYFISFLADFVMAGLRVRESAQPKVRPRRATA